MAIILIYGKNFMNTKVADRTTIHAERAILGAILNDPPVFFQVSDILIPEHFSRDFHGRIFTALQDVMMTGKKPSLQLILSKLGDEYDDGKSTINYLTALLRDVEEDDAALLDFVDGIVEAWARRKMLDMAKWLEKEAAKVDGNSADTLAALEERSQMITLRAQSVPVVTIGESASRALRKSISAQESGVVFGCDTGLPSLDEILGRIQPGDLGVIGGPQGTGKTIVGMQICRRAQIYEPSAIFELEMDDEDLGRRALAEATDLSTRQIVEGTYEMFDVDALRAAEAALMSERVFIDDRPGLTAQQIRDRCFQLKHTRGLGLIVIDHLRLVEVVGRFQSKFDRIEWVTKFFKVVAKSLGIAVILLTQVTRTAQRRDGWEPQVHDFDGGSSIEQDADWILGLARKDKYLAGRRPLLRADEDPESNREYQNWLTEYRAAKGKMQVFNMKNRRMGDGGMREFLFNGRAGRLDEL